MHDVTLAFSVAAVVLVVFLPSRYAMIVYLFALLCYPSYLGITVAGCNFTVGRFVGLALFIRSLMNEQLRRGFRWTRLDTLLVIADGIYILALVAAPGAEFSDVMKGQSGVLFDTTFAYFATRLIVNNTSVLMEVVRYTAAVLAILACLGIFEAFTTFSPYKGLMKYSTKQDDSAVSVKFENQDVIVGHGHEERYGFFRAQGPYSHPIIFGGVFALFIPLIWKLLCRGRWKGVRVPASALFVLGGASSVSSTPFSALLISLAGLAFERFERWGKHVLLVFVAFCMFTEFYSARSHFYSVIIGRLSFGGGDGYFRIRLIDTAIEHLPEYWLTGYGGKDPGWGLEISDFEYTDLCVHYVFLAVQYGIFGLMAYLAVVVQLLLWLRRKYKRSTETLDRDICWALLVSVFLTLILDLGVTPFGVLPSIYSVIFGIGGSVISATFRSQNGKGGSAALATEASIVRQGRQG